MLERFPFAWTTCRSNLGRAASALATTALVGVVVAFGPGTVPAAAAADSVEVFAELAVSGEGGADAVREVRLFVDGVDVTDRSTIGALRIAHSVEGLEPGEHSARVVVTDALGRTVERSWTFEVEEGEPPLEVVAFFSDELFVELDALPPRVRSERLLVGGTTQPDAEIEISVERRVVERLVASASGRFETAVDLPLGVVEIEVQAERPWTGELGRVARARLERVGDGVAALDPRRPRLASPGPIAPGGLGDVGSEAPDLRWPDSPATRERRVRPQPPAGEVPGRPDADAGDLRTVEPPTSRPRPDAPDPAGPGRPDAASSDELREPPARVVITKPTDGDSLVPRRVTVLGLAPAGWRVVVERDASPVGEDVANPAGRFTVPAIDLEPGENVLVAIGHGPDGQLVASAPVRVVQASPHGTVAQTGLVRTLSLASSTTSRRVVRDEIHRVEGRAWPGAEVTALVGGRAVARELAGADGRFDLEVALERGPNHLLVEALDARSGDAVTSAMVTLTRVGSVRAGERRRVTVSRPGAPSPGLRGVLGREVPPLRRDR